MQYPFSFDFKETNSANNGILPKTNPDKYDQECVNLGLKAFVSVSKPLVNIITPKSIWASSWENTSSGVSDQVRLQLAWNFGYRNYQGSEQ